jgi:hypothetical protein
MFWGVYVELAAGAGYSGFGTVVLYLDVQLFLFFLLILPNGSQLWVPKIRPLMGGSMISGAHKTGSACCQ